MRKTILNKLKKVQIKKALPTLKDNLVNFIKYNRQFLSYTILSLLSCMLIRHFTIGHFWDFDAIFFDFSVIVLLGSLAYFFKPKKQFIYFFTILCIITLMNVINGVYYAFFNSYASFGLLASMGQTAEVTDAVFEKLSLANFVYLLAPLIFFMINRYLKGKDYFNVVEKIEASKRLLVSVALIGGICLFINISTLSGTDISRFSKQWNREYVVQRFGIIIYQGNDLFQTLKSQLNSMFGYEEAAKNFVEYFEEHPNEKSDNKFTNKYKDYNVIVMHMESIMSFLIDLKINGKEVTPNLNKLVKESIYFDHFYPQVSAGTSSDTEFTFSSSLMPVQSGTVFVSYFNRSYETLQHLLADKGYYTFSMHGNKASMWNRNKMHPTLGYMDFYSEEYYTIDERIGLGLSDRSFFKQSEELIKKIDEMVKSSEEYNHFMGTMITLTNHTPFNDPYYLTGDNVFDVRYHTGKVDASGQEIIYDYLESKELEEMGKYIRSVHYADECLGEFLNYVKTHDEYDKTLFVFYGDHAAQISKSQFNKFTNYDFLTGEQKTEENPTYVDYDYYEHELNKNTPLIFWTKDKQVKKTYSYYMGMLDVLPTLANMLGLETKYALGHDIFEVKNNNTVLFPNGNFVTNKLYYYNSKNESRIFGMETIDDNYIEERKKYTEQILDLSNDIIVYDLIGKASNRIGDTVNE